jgi:hypothetical protein
MTLCKILSVTWFVVCVITFCIFITSVLATLLILLNNQNPPSYFGLLLVILLVFGWISYFAHHYLERWSRSGKNRAEMLMYIYFALIFFPLGTIVGLLSLLAIFLREAHSG